MRVLTRRSPVRLRWLSPTAAAVWIFRFLLLLPLGLVASRQAGAAGETTNPNLVPNPGFEDPSVADDNLWDGVDSAGYLSGFRHSASAVTETRNFDGVAMPPSVGFVDLNGDGKPDLITADPTGYFRFYPNSGTPAAPRFTTGEIIPFFVSTTFKPREHEWSNNGSIDPWRFCPRFALADWRRNGSLDFLIGNYYGEMFFIPNVGSARQPAYRQPTNGLETARINTSEKNRFWANLLAPAAVDWNGDGKLDLIAGEGTYSADAIHLIENTGTGDLPKFTDAKHTTIAYGDGREHLIPTTVDYDGDGSQDLIVADRSGEIGVYINPGKGKQSTDLKRVSTVTFGGTAKLPGLVAPYAADFNGDGLFDLIVGEPNGHVAVALNTGTKGQPSFGPLQDIKGTDRLVRNVKPPKSWTTNTFPMYGNALAYFSVVDANDDPASKPAGAHCLKAGYWPLPGETFAVPAEGMPGALKHFVVYSPRLTLEYNKTYQVSFKVKNVGMKDLHYAFTSHFFGVPPGVKVERGERGEIKNRADFADEWSHEGKDFTAGSEWTTVTGTISPRYKNLILKDLTQATGVLEIEFAAANTSNVVYFDDFSLVKQGR